MASPPQRVLLVEGDPRLAQSIQTFLEGHRISVLLAPIGQDPVPLIRNDRPDLILLSVDLPQKSGFLVCKELKEQEALRSIPVILMAGQDKAKDLDQHRKLKVRAEDYLTKPFTDEEMLYKIHNLLGFPIDGDQLGALQQKVLDFVQEKAALESKIQDLQSELERTRNLLRTAEAEKGSVEARVTEMRERETRLTATLEQALREMKGGRG